MAARRYAAEAAALLVVGAAAHYGWQHAPAEAQADTWNASQAFLALLLLAMVGNAYRSGWMWAAVALVGAWTLQVAACSLLWLAEPWPVLPGQEQCSARWGVPLGAIGLWLALLLAAAMSQRAHPREADHDAAG